jgi:hypothetical protein
VASCIKADASLGLQIVQGKGRVACPKDSVVISGGYQGGKSSQQAGNGWTSDGAKTYAICAAYALNLFNP